MVRRGARLKMLPIMSTSEWRRAGRSSRSRLSRPALLRPLDPGRDDAEDGWARAPAAPAGDAIHAEPVRASHLERVGRSGETA